MFDDKNDETQLLKSNDETVIDDNDFEQNPNSLSLSDAEKNVALDWNAGDIILELYEVKPVDDYGKVFHAGGFGKVYKVHHKTWNMDLAVKAPHAHTFKTQKQKDNYIKECQSWIELGIHPNIATCYYVRELGGVPRIFAEYVTEGSLKEWIESGRLYEGNSETEVLKTILNIAIQFAWGLHYAHEKGLVHQDVKPQNVMIAEKNEVKVVDFGLARAKTFGGMFDSSTEVAQSIMVTSAGGYTPAYCSPEQIRGKKLTRRTDMWSWGVSVMEMFTGGVTWKSGVLAAQSLESFLEHNGEEEDIPPMPKGVVELLRRCFEIEEINRPKTMLDIADQLIEIYEGECNQEYSLFWRKGVSDTPDVLNNYALSYLDLGDFNKSKSLWEKAQKSNSQHLDSIYNSGLSLWRTGQISDLELLEKMKNIKNSNKNSWLYHSLLGSIHMERDDAKSAVESYEEALKISRDNEVALAALAIAKETENNCSKHLRTIKGAFREFTSIALTPDGKYVLAVGEERKLSIWDVETTKIVRTFQKYIEYIKSIVITKDGRYAITSDYDMKYWDLIKGTYILTLSGHKVGVSAFDISCDGHYAVSGGQDETIRIFDIQTNMILRTIRLKEQWPNCLIISTDMKFIISANYNKLYLWEFATGNCLRIFEGHNRVVNALVMTTDSDYVISASDDGYIKLWEVETGLCIRTFKGNQNPVSTIVIEPDNQHILTGEGDSSGGHNIIRRFDIFTGQCQTLFDCGSTFKIRSLALSADGHCLISKGYDTEIQVWRIADLTVKAQWSISKPISVTEAIKKEALYTGYLKQAQEFIDKSNYIDAAKSVIKAMSLPGNQRLKEVLDVWAIIYQYLPKGDFKIAWELKNYENHLDVFSAETRRTIQVKIDSINDDLKVTVKDFYKNDYLWEFNVENKDIITVELKTKEHYLSTSSNQSISLYNLKTGQLLNTFNGHKASVSCSILTPSEKYVISGSEDKTVKIWDVSSGKCVHTLKGHTKYVSRLATSKDSQYVFSGSDDGTIRQWEIATGKIIKIFCEYTNLVKSIAVSGDGKQMISSQSNVFILWDIQTGKLIRKFEGHKAELNTVVITPDGKNAISASGLYSLDNTIKLWNLATGKCVHTFEGHRYGIMNIIISADGRYILSSNDSEIKLWELIWNIVESEPSDWHDGAEAYLRNFISIHQHEIKMGVLKHKMIIEWTEEDFNRLMIELSYRGFGFLKAEGVRLKLEEIRNQF